LEVKGESKDSSWGSIHGMTPTSFLKAGPNCCVLYSELDFKGARSDPICNNRGGEQGIQHYGGELFKGK